MIEEGERSDGAILQSDVDAFKTQRAVIEQAKGVLMQLLSVDEAQAFAVLSRYSQHRNIKVHELARRLTAAAAMDITPAKGANGGAIERLLDRLTGEDSAHD